MAYTNDSQKERVVRSEARKRGGVRQANAVLLEWAVAKDEYADYKNTFEGMVDDLPKGIYFLTIVEFCAAVVRLNTLNGFIKRIQGRPDYPRMFPSHKLAQYEMCLFRKCEPFERMLLC